VVENQYATSGDYMAPVIRMLQSITNLEHDVA
jgi:hypothetical protein